MKDPVVIGLIAALMAAMAVGLYLFYLPRRRRPTAMEIEHSEFRKKQNELLWAENTELKEQLPKLEGELIMLRSGYSDVNAERERWKKEADDYKAVAESVQKSYDKMKVERDEWKVKAESLAPTLQAANNQLKTAEKERDQARALANDLREYLDRALKIVNEQNEQIRNLTPVEARKHSVRGKDGRFVKAMPTPTPVKHLREVNEEMAKAAEVQPTEGELPDDSHVGEQAQPADMPPVRDWNVPQAFPENYIIPIGTKVMAVANGGYTKSVCVVGDTGIVDHYIEGASHGARVKFEGKEGAWFMKNINLAPIDPRQHPEHPEFIQTAEQKGVEV